MDDPRTHFLSQLDLSKTRVRAFEGFVLLCGGASGADAHPVKSVRHLIQSELTNGRHSEIAKRVRLAEETNDWFDGGVYSDLVTFEEHLAGLSAVVVLIVETAGSIAELGAFSVSTPFIDRLLVIISQDHYSQDSFIRLGPIQKLENASPESVLVYDWHERAVGGRLTENFELIRADLTEVVSKIQGYVSPSGRQHVFRATEPAHVMSLICELCDLFGALNESDIAGYLAKLSLPVDAKQLSQYIFLLQKCQILFMKPRGHGRYFYVENWSGRVSFAYQEGAKFNKERLKVDTVSYYEAELPSRASIVKSIRRA
ncbi:retron St85 family effector protein [Stenotrophomonas maltophilia]|uniref:retron St85 family effector protein n=1 Tax=Stenotrophomonas maltophilia TaxID=40324 RepID=UPI001D0BF851|nr:retron St85 family effector protein [Stenotrophomonas maltophilia]UXF72561.1 retron St85 family effector protein [Stenotrophomonas maltophilia]